MPGFSRRPLAVFVCCLFVAAQTSHAADDVLRLQLSGARATGESLDESPEIMLLAAADVPLRLRPNLRPARRKVTRRWAERFGCARADAVIF